MSKTSDLFNNTSLDLSEIPAADIIREKFKDLTISQETKELIQGLTLSRKEMEDERTRYILVTINVERAARWAARDGFRRKGQPHFRS